MTRVVLSGVLLVTTLAFAMPAQAQLTRTFVSSAGSDTNPCTVTAPCASFSRAYGLTAAFGIVAALDPGKYGPLTITNPITINGNGWAAITAPSGGAGITINAPNDSGEIVLTGLEIDGAGAGANGIVYNSGNGLTVTNCVLQYFVSAGAGNGILIAPTANGGGYRVFNTTIANNGGSAILIAPPSGSPSVGGDIEHLTAITNTNGIVINTTAMSGGSAGFSIYNSSINSNSGNGIWLNNTTSGVLTEASIDNAAISGNGTGLVTTNTAIALLRRSSIVGNTTGVNIAAGSTVNSYSDNSINANTSGNDVVGTLSYSYSLR
jgi:nitrous oxidase accessory protein NosD